MSHSESDNLTPEPSADEQYDDATSVEKPHSATTSLTVTLLLFMAALALVRVLVPGLVEQIHYAMERGKQRAEFESAGTQLSDQPLLGLSKASELVSQRIAPSVVHIDTKRTAAATNAEDESAFLFGNRRNLEVQGQGSGVIMDASGKIITNYHVIEGAEQITVTLSDDRRVSASVIGVDPVTDLAVLRISAKGLMPATWGDSDAMREGALVWAVGSPFGLSKSITFGILSARNRRSYDHGAIQEYLQSDAEINQGNSGGPLVDTQGRVVGINTAILGHSYQGVGFAIPSSTAKEIYGRLLVERQVARGWLGVRLGDMSPEQAIRKGTTHGALIAGLVDDSSSPARLAGIRPGDVITRWDGNKVDSPTTLSNLIAKTEIDALVQIELFRRGTKQTLNVEVGERPLQF